MTSILIRHFEPIRLYSKLLSTQPRNLIAIAFLLIIALFGLTSGGFQPTAHADNQRIVSLYVDGQKRVITTDATTVEQLLARSSVKLSSGDLVEPAPATPIPVGFYNVNVYRARPVVVHDAIHVYQFASSYQSAHLLAEEAGLTLFPEDTYDMKVSTDVTSPTDIGVDVVVHRATPITIKVDGTVRHLRTQAKTLGQALTAGGVQLGLKDTLSLPAPTPVVPDLTVDVTRVTDVTATLTEALPFTTKVVSDPNMLKGQSKTQTAGLAGAKVATWQIHYQNGAETTRTLVKLLSQTEPTTEVDLVGTKVLFAGSVEYWRPQVEAAAAQFGLDPNRMLRIMACESGGNATSVSHFIVNGQHPEGLFQFLPTTWTSAGGSPENILDGSVQIELAAKKMAHEGFSAWQCQ